MSCKKVTLEIQKEIMQYLSNDDVFEEVMHLSGKAFRDVPGRKTIQVRLGSNSYFIKQHFGVGWREIFKNLLTFKLPILGAKTEKLAIEKMDNIGLATTPLVGFGEQGCNPATRQSFLITQDLGNIISLEDLCAGWKTNPPLSGFKRRLVIAVAKLARTLHTNGLNHRDFYMCHLCLNEGSLGNGQIRLALIDLHRMLIHKQPSVDDNMKDIAALYFSSMDLGFTARDYLRFRHYYSQGVKSVNKTFWQQVIKRANKLYAKFHSGKFQQRLAVEKAALKK
ncbi:MAG: lipopolysaccharide core heptose(I) kinase RfaP [Methylotenera sp.]|nr:lipopolysaccharide core heptose(I) kinase RfaP [Methylotenera sp.]